MIYTTPGSSRGARFIREVAAPGRRCGENAAPRPRARARRSPAMARAVHSSHMTVPATRDLPRSIGFWGTLGVMIGIMIGSGIFRSPPAIAGSLGSPGLILLLWL